MTTAAKGDHHAADHAAELYGGQFLAEEDYPWAELIREDLKRKAIDHLTTLAERKQAAGDVAGAARTIEQAIASDPYAEDLYEKLIRLQLDMGRRDAARRTYQLLERRLCELELTPSRKIGRLIDDNEAS